METLHSAPETLSHVWARAASTTARWAALVLVGVSAIFNAFDNLTRQNNNSDEWTYVTVGWQYVHGNYANNREHPPFGKYLYGWAQELGHQGVTAPRIVVSAFALAAGFALFLWIRKELGWWCGILAFTLWSLFPRGIATGTITRIDRVAMLDPLMTAFAVFALIALWGFVKYGHWWCVPVSAILLSMSVLTKVPTAVLVPIFLAAPLMYKARRRWWKYVVFLVAWLVTFALTSYIIYRPVGIWSSLRYMVTFQGQQNTHGHPVTIAGKNYVFSPWWGVLWNWRAGVGWLAFIIIAAGIVAACVIKPDRLVLLLGLVILVIAIFYMVVARIDLSYYYYPIAAIGAPLAAIGWTRCLRLLRPIYVQVIASIVVACVVAVPSVAFARQVTDARLHNEALLPAVITDYNLLCRDGEFLLVNESAGAFASSYAPCGVVQAASALKGKAASYIAIVVGTDARYPAPQTIADFMKNNRAYFHIIHVDELVVWIPNGRVAWNGKKLSVAPR